MRIIFTRPDGNISIVYAAPKESLEQALGALTDDEYKKHIWERSIPKDALNPAEIADEYQLPNDEFRDSWIFNGKEVSHDYEKAQYIQLARVRYKRDALLMQYDALQMQAMDANDEAALKELRTMKQFLRDCTNDLKNSSPKSIEEIKKLTPDLTAYKV